MRPDFNKYTDGLMPAIVQDSNTLQVLMLGYMNETAYEQTIEKSRVTFFSRSRNELWEKGLTSGSFLIVKEITTDCDKDCLLIKAEPTGPVCHTGVYTCFGEDKRVNASFMQALEQTIVDRKENPTEDSYTSKLFAKGIPKIAQKVGEEAVELTIEAMRNEDDLFINEAADLMFHFMVLLQVKGRCFDDVVQTLRGRVE